MTTVTDSEIVEAMLMFGGSFAKALAHAYQLADPMNQARIKGAFPDLWASYAKMVRMRRQREGT